MGCGRKSGAGAWVDAHEWRRHFALAVYPPMVQPALKAIRIGGHAPPGGAVWVFYKGALKVRGRWWWWATAAVLALWMLLAASAPVVWSVVFRG